MSVIRGVRLNIIDAAVVFFLLWFGSYAYLYAFQIGGPKPLYSYFLLLGTVSAYALYRSAKHRPLIPVADQWMAMLFGWLAVYFVYGSFQFLRSTQDQWALQDFITLGEMVLLTGAFVGLLAEARRVDIASAAFALLAAVGTAVNLWDFFIPTFSKVPGRAAGLYVNPGIAGSFIALAMVAGITQVPHRLRWFYLLLCGTGVVVTFSRESWIIWGLAVLGLAWQGYLNKGRQRWLVLIIGGAVGLGVVVGLFSGFLGDIVADSSLSSYLTPNTKVRLGIGASSLSDDSAQLRENLIYGSLELASRHPWLGYGLGEAVHWDYAVGTHNMYLLFLVQGGVTGLFLYLSLMALLWRASAGVGKLLMLQIAVSSLFSHNHLDQPAIVLIMAFIVAGGAAARAKRTPATAVAHAQAYPSAYS
ncbi:MAG: O-antigen ligase family protein [Nitrococcus sp.]|nr:O-antigen ligase family protein [Nitrococcus sp.]